MAELECDYMMQIRVQDKSQACMERPGRSHTITQVAECPMSARLRTALERGLRKA